MRYFIFLFSFFVMFSTPANAKLVMEKKDNSIYVTSATAKEISELFEKYKFGDYTQSKSKFPRIYMKKLPTDWEKVSDNEEKHKLFIQILIPLVLKVNEQILRERTEVENVIKKYNDSFENINKADVDFLEEKAKKYDVFTRLKDRNRVPYLVKNILEKIDIMPISVIVSTAAIYTNWGQSRLARQYNSLFLDEIWYQDKGIKPLNDEEADYRYETYASLEDCLIARALKLNTHINYFYFRVARERNRTLGQQPYGQQIVAQMLLDSNLKNIVGLIDYTFSFYHMSDGDFFPELEDVK